MPINFIFVLLHTGQYDIISFSKPHILHTSLFIFLSNFKGILHFTHFSIYPQSLQIIEEECNLLLFIIITFLFNS